MSRRSDCAGVSDCLACVNAAAADEMMSHFAAVGFASPENESQLNKCQRAVIDSSVDLAVVQANLMQKCWDAQVAKPVDPPPACGVLGPRKFSDAFFKARVKQENLVCKACGGKQEKGCSGSDDFTPSQIGFPATCRVGLVPNTGLKDIARCVYVIGQSDNQCRDVIGVPSLDVPFGIGCTLSLR